MLQKNMKTYCVKRKKNNENLNGRLIMQPKFAE